MNATLLAIVGGWSLIWILLVIAASAALRVGVLCLVVEAVFINAALSSVILSSIGVHISAALVLGFGVGVVTIGLFFVLSVLIGLDEIVTGIAVNMFSAGSGLLALYLATGQRSAELIGAGDATLLAASVLGVMLCIACFVFLERSVYRTRVAAVEASSEVAKLTNISVLRYRGLGMLVTGCTAAMAGVYLALFQRSISGGIWSQGFGFLALGVAVGVRGSILKGTFVAVGLAVLRGLTLQRPSSYVVLDTLWQVAPYMIVLVIVATVNRPTKRRNAPVKLARSQ